MLILNHQSFVPIDSALLTASIEEEGKPLEVKVINVLKKQTLPSSIPPKLLDFVIYSDSEVSKVESLKKYAVNAKFFKIIEYKKPRASITASDPIADFQIHEDLFSTELLASVIQNCLIQNSFMNSVTKSATIENKSDWLSAVVHDLRTPMTSIHGFADLLDDDDLSRFDKKDYIDNIRRSTRHIKSILNNMLQHAGVDVEKYKSFSIPDEKFDQAGLSNKAKDKEFKALLVDDNEDSLAALSAMLKKIGCTVEITRAAVQALDHLENDNQLDVIITDIHMPGMSGLDLIDILLRRREEGQIDKNTRIIALTGDASKDIDYCCSYLGVDELLLKPLGLKDLKQALG